MVTSVLAAFLCGLVFALGLGLAGMTSPARVVGFLDVAGDWDPRLAFVMAGAVVVGLVTVPRILARGRALTGAAFALPSLEHVDAQLVVGAALFGIGWGLSGYCPGPAVVSLALGNPSVMLFVASMLIGLVAGDRLRRLL